MTSAHDSNFGDAISRVYESHLVPLIFEPYAASAARRLASFRPRRVLEIACGTGALTRALASVLPRSTIITATDASFAMLEQARRAGAARHVVWRQANALGLPFSDASVDAVICHFGVMFFSDKRKAFSEARRVLRPGGVFLFSVWDRIVENEFADVVTTALAERFPHAPPRFLARVPHGYFDRTAITNDLAKGGFTPPFDVHTVEARSLAASPLEPAVAYCEGTPLRDEIEAIDAGRLREATLFAAEAIRKRFGPGPVDGKIQALVFTAVP